MRENKKSEVFLRPHSPPLPDRIVLILILYYFKHVYYRVGIQCNDSRMTHLNLARCRSTMTHLVKISDRTIILLYINKHVRVTPDKINM